MLVVYEFINYHPSYTIQLFMLELMWKIIKIHIEVQQFRTIMLVVYEFINYHPSYTIQLFMLELMWKIINIHIEVLQVTNKFTYYLLRTIYKKSNFLVRNN